MIYKNSTSTWIELVHGDIREADERFFVIGRDPFLKTHFEARTGNAFRSNLSWIRGTPLELSRSNDRSLSAVRIQYRPRNRPRGFEEQVERLRSEVEYPLAHAIAWCDANRIAMCPISCRRPEVVATAMVRMIWDFSVAAFLNVTGPFRTVKPTLFRIYCIDGIHPLVDALGSRQDCGFDHGWLFSMEICCNRAKRKRFTDRCGFRFRHLKSGNNVVHRRPRSGVS
ncbi:MAG: hypothetical protein H0T47_05900 [Planctomycetaceae bacterium]|nr:hypothetical protein [Planctomycetaceae bacterium]